MDKRKVILAYQRGLLTVNECAQLLGVESVKMMDVVQHQVADRQSSVKHQTVNS